MLAVDFHSHSIASHHATNTIEELLREASRRGVKGVAITDHAPGMDNLTWLLKNEGPDFDPEKRLIAPDYNYFSVFLSRYESPRGLDVRLFKGIECNILEMGSPAVDVPPRLAAHFDLILASLHLLDGLFQPTSREHVTDRFLAALEEPIDVIGHPYNNHLFPFFEPVVLKAKERGIALELNNSSFAMNKAPREAGLELLQLTKRVGGRISLGSDTHVANEIGNDQQLRLLLKEADFPEELIVNGTLDQAIAFTEARKRIRVQMSHSL